MEFEEKLNQFRTKIPRLKSRIQTEEGTKNSLILPLFDIMGYDTRDPFEVNPEYTADFGVKQKEKVDYAILIDDKPVMLVEAKPYSTKLSIKNRSQLFRYFTVSEARIGILTNGLQYLFFSDLVKENTMDDEPFFEIDLEQPLSDTDVAQLKKFRKEEFDVENIVPSAIKMKNLNALYDIIATEMKNPSEELIRYLARDIHEGVFNKKALEQYRPLIVAAFDQLQRDFVQNALNKFHADLEDRSKPIEDDNTASEPVIVTTEEEVLGLSIVRAIGSKLVTPERIVMRDAKTYCPIFLDNNNRKPICIMHFDAKKKFVEIPDESGNKVSYTIESPVGLYAYQDEILNAIKRYIN